MRDLQREFISLPKTGAPGELLKIVDEDLEHIKDLLLQVRQVHLRLENLQKHNGKQK